MRIEEPKRSTQRVATDEQHSDIKLSAACRSVGDGSNRAGKGIVIEGFSFGGLS